MSALFRCQKLLRRALAANALFSALSAVAMISASGAIGNLIGLEAAQVMSLGIELAFFAAGLTFLFTRSDLSRGWVRPAILGVIVLDMLWVVGSAIVLLSPTVPFTTVGRWAVFAVAVVVADFAAVQGYAWWRTRRQLHPTPAS